MFCSALLLTIGFLAWVPPRSMWCTVLEADTICGLSTARLPGEGRRYAGLFDRFTWLGSPAGLVLVSLIAFAAVTLLCTPPVRRALRFATTSPFR